MTAPTRLVGLETSLTYPSPELRRDVAALAAASADFDRKHDALLIDLRAERVRLANLNSKGAK